MSTGTSSHDLSHRQLLERSETLAKENAMLCKTLKAYKEKSVNISHLVDKYKQLQALYKDLQGQKETLSAEVDKARKALSAIKSTCQPSNVQKLEAKLQKLTSERDTVQHGLSTCTIERDQMKAKLEEETARSRQLAKERDELAAVAMDTRILIKDCALEISHLRSEVRDLKRDAADRSGGDNVLSDIAAIKGQLAALEQRFSERSCAQAVADADVASLTTQQLKTAVELQRIRAVFSAVAASAENGPFVGACSPGPPVRHDAPVPTHLVGPQCYSPPSPQLVQAPSSMSGPTALQRMRSSSPDAILASATVHSMPQPRIGTCATSEAGEQGMQATANTASAVDHTAPSMCVLQHSRSTSPKREGSSPPYLMRSSTRCSTAGDTPTHSECALGPTQPVLTDQGAPASGPGRSRSPDATTRQQIVPRKRLRPASACKATKETCAEQTAADPVAPVAPLAVRADTTDVQIKPSNPMKRQAPRPQAGQRSNPGSTAPAAKERPVLPVRRVDCPMPKVMFQASAAQAKAPPRVAMRLGSGKVKSTFITGSGFQLAARNQASANIKPQPNGDARPASRAAAAPGRAATQQRKRPLLADTQETHGPPTADQDAAQQRPATSALPGSGIQPVYPAAAPHAEVVNAAAASSAAPGCVHVVDASPPHAAGGTGSGSRASPSGASPCTASVEASMHAASSKACPSATRDVSKACGNVAPCSPAAQADHEAKPSGPAAPSTEQVDAEADKLLGRDGVSLSDGILAEKGPRVEPPPPEPSEPLPRMNETTLNSSGAVLTVPVAPATNSIRQLTASQLHEQAPLLASCIPDLVCSSARSKPVVQLPEVRRATCISTLAAAVLGSPVDKARDSAACAREVAGHWMATDRGSRQQLADACAECATSALSQSCESIGEPTVLRAMQKLTAAADASQGLVHGDGLSALAWDFLRLWDDLVPSAACLSIRHLLEVCGGACSMITAADPGCACAWSCYLAHALGDAVVTLLSKRPEGPHRTSRWLQIVLLSVLACSVYGCHRNLRCDHGARLVGRLLCAAAGSIEDALGVVLAVVQCEPMGALGRHLAAQRQFWQGFSGEPRNVALRPAAAMVAVGLNVMVTGACQDDRGALTKAVGAATQLRGVRLWGWCRVGTAAITKLCAALVQMLTSAVDGGLEVGQASWLMCDEFLWLQARLGTAGSMRPGDRVSCEKQPSAASQSSSSSGSSSDDGSSGGSEAHSSGASGEPGHGSPKPDTLGRAHCAALSAAKEEVAFAMELAAELCGWKWTAEELVDRIVWPAVQKLHAMQSSKAELLCSCLARLVETLLNKIVLISNNDSVACEYVASTREALQFVS